MRNIDHFYKQNLPAGRYWIGDPSFLFQGKRGRKKWQTIINKTNFFLTPHYHDEVLEMWASDTGIGEGLFYSSNDDPVIIESGILGIIPVKYVINPLYIKTDLHKRGFIVQFDFEFEMAINDGIFKFGNVLIDSTDSCIETFEELE